MKLWDVFCLLFQAIQVKKIEIENSQKICKKIAIAAQEDLNAALPALEEARKVCSTNNNLNIFIFNFLIPSFLINITFLIDF